MARQRGAAGRRAAAFLVALALVVVLHLVLAHTSMHTATPLWGVEWLYTALLDAAILVLSTALGRKLAGPLAFARGEPLADTLAALAIGFGLLSLAILALGLAHLLYGPLFLAVALVLAWWLRAEIRRLWRDACLLAGRLKSGRLLRSQSIAMQIPMLTLAVTIVFACLRTAVPLLGDEQDFDGVSYHVVAPKLYLAAHHIFALPDVSLANAPSASEMFAIPGLMAGTDLQMKVLNLFFSLLLGLALYGFTKRHLRPDAAILAVLLLFLPIWIVNLMSSTVVDCATALFAVLALDDLAAWLSASLDPRSGRSPHLRLRQGDTLLVRAGLLAGLAVSCKLTTAPLLPAMMLAVSATCLTARRLPILLRLLLVARGALLPAACAALPLAPWFLKNIAFFHNPLYPIGQLVNGVDCTGGVEVCAPSAKAQGSSLPPFVQEWWHLVVNVMEMYWQFTTPLCLATLLAILLFRTPPARFCSFFLIFGTILWWKFVPLFNPPRYWLSMMAIGFCLSAAALAWLIDRVPIRRSIAELPLAAYLIAYSLTTLVLAAGLAQRTDAFNLVGGSESRYEFLQQRVRPYRAMDWVNVHAAPGTEVAVVNSVLGYYLERPYLGDWFGARLGQLQAGGPAMQAQFADWCRHGVSLAVFNRGKHEYNSDSAAEIRPPAAYAWLRAPGLDAKRLYTWRGVDVLSVHPCPASSP